MSNFPTPKAETVSIFGSTGSIGVQALEVIRNSESPLAIHALSANSNLELLCVQISEFNPRVVVVGSAEMAGAIRERFAGLKCRIGSEGLSESAGEADVALNAVVGFAGLSVTLGALAAGRRLALANKESLVAGGAVVRAALANSGAEIVPVDSEHAAIHQCLRAGSVSEVARLVLTTSGGPFRSTSAEALASVSKADALRHPTWSMGPKITVDSSTLMNKALEIIEAVELFSVRPDQVEVVVHPQSVVHSMVGFVDGSLIAQLSEPDMRLPIAYALGYPARCAPEYGTIDFSRSFELGFEPPRREVFRGLDFAYHALEIGNGAPAWLNAVNEVAVTNFLDDRINWCDIYPVIESSLELFVPVELKSVQDVVALDQMARLRCWEVIEKKFASPR